MPSDPTDGELPKLELFIKMMKMTDAEETVALVALRKANAILRENGWDWERLLRGKVKIIANPFASGGPTIPPVETRKAPPPRPQSPPPPPPAAPQYAPNPWPSGRRPQPAPRPQAPPPPQPQRPAVAPVGPLHFRKSSNDVWCIASHQRIDPKIGHALVLEKRDGSQATETCGPFVEQLASGHYLYQIAHATKWKRKSSADQLNINDLNP